DFEENGIIPIYVFDGIPSVLKEKTIKARMQRRENAYASWQNAMQEGNMEQAKAFAMQSTHVNKAIVESAKELLRYMGIPYINAPSEGEAQCSYMCAKGQAYAVASQDYDTMLFGAPLAARNLAIQGRRKLPRKNVYISIEPELASLADTLANLQITREQLVWMGMLIGTDFNDGIKGIGPKTALKLAKSYSSIEEIEEYVNKKYNASFNVDAKDVVNLFMHPDVRDVDESELHASMDKSKLVEFMCDVHGFDRDRIERYAGKLASIKEMEGQQGIRKWFA
ncbi:MAG: hypothetical protein QW139_03010, partial [Candidatus Micrarchaeaceae archaeon]